MRWHFFAAVPGTDRPAARWSILQVAFPAVVLAIASATASADIHRCTDAEGLVTFTDSPSRKFKSCVLLYRDAQAPASRAEPPPGAPASGAPASGAPRARGDSPAATVRGNPGPENFPRVERTEQRDRDLKARQIVERELANEQRLLEDARRQAAALGQAAAADRPDPRLRDLQNTVSRHERNIAEIQRQLAVMK
jgi:hypothetical protein